VDFSSGQSFSLRLSDLLPLEELGKGNYGTVVHVIHRVTNAHMAMKQIKLELDNSKFMAIITELQVSYPLRLPCLYLLSLLGCFGWMLIVGAA
jgi:mitogen-activated protein kinase kinase